MDGQEAFVVSGSEEGDVVAWDVSTKEILWRSKEHTQPVLAVDFCRLANGQGLLVSGGLDRDLRVWVEVDEDGKEILTAVTGTEEMMVEHESQEGLINGIHGEGDDQEDADMDGDL